MMRRDMTKMGLLDINSMNIPLDTMVRSRELHSIQSYLFYEKDPHIVISCILKKHLAITLNTTIRDIVNHQKVAITTLLMNGFDSKFRLWLVAVINSLQSFWRDSDSTLM